LVGTFFKGKNHSSLGGNPTKKGFLLGKGKGYWEILGHSGALVGFKKTFSYFFQKGRAGGSHFLKGGGIFLPLARGRGRIGLTWEGLFGLNFFFKLGGTPKISQL